MTHAEALEILYEIEFSYPALTPDHPCFQSEKECPFCGGLNLHYTPEGGQLCGLKRLIDWHESKL